ncbi:amidohydrolase family protein [Streptomyces phyllanthi]|uniref:Amidohydrolase family protein n=1 Tax=Streptomyces phyllanthi TaxID=1803180 RepID=A0A5N8W5Z2_9ACTN|nr:amidohydrolase family protein [Streptomyces phyllanthi]MPY42900.1 amidohydrolase family protein [Streptomyces phyllanthi]
MHSDTPSPSDTQQDPHDRSKPPLGRRSFLARAGTGLGVTALGLGATAAARPEAPARTPSFQSGRPIVFRGATVVTGDPQLGVQHNADVLVVGSTIRAVGRNVPAPASAAVIDGRDRILMPGMIDTHRHMWQTVVRGVGAEWTIQNYLQWIYKDWSKHWRPEDVYAGNYLSMVEALNSGVTTSLDWSQVLHTPEHADAAADALFDSKGRARLAYGNIFAPPQEWIGNGDVDRLLRTRFSSKNQLVTLQLAWDAPWDTAFPDRPAWEFARDRDLMVTQHAGVWGFPLDLGIKILHDNGFLLPTNTYVHASSLGDDSYRMIADTGGNVSISAESELNAGQGYPPTGKIRRHGIPISLSMDTSVWWSSDMFSAMRATLNADRGLDHLEAHAEGKTVHNNDLRTEDVIHYATQGGANALGLGSSLGSITPGKLADLVLLRADTPSMVPLTNPCHQIVFQATRAEVDTVLVDGRVLKYGGELVHPDMKRAKRLAEASRDHVRDLVGAQEWAQAQDPPAYRVA